MKVIIKPAEQEQSKLFCDITGKPLNGMRDLGSKLTMNFGYGSQRDLDVLSLDLSAEAAEEIFKFLVGKYGDKVLKCYRRSEF